MPRPVKRPNPVRTSTRGWPSGNWIGKPEIPLASTGMPSDRYATLAARETYSAPTKGIRERARLMRTSYRGSKWRKLSKEIKARDNHVCQSCGIWGPDVYLEVDHIVEWADGGSNDPSNLWTLCKRCHAHKSELTARAMGRPGRGSR